HVQGRRAGGEGRARDDDELQVLHVGVEAVVVGEVLVVDDLVPAVERVEGAEKVDGVHAVRHRAAHAQTLVGPELVAVRLDCAAVRGEVGPAEVVDVVAGETVLMDGPTNHLRVGSAVGGRAAVGVRRVDRACIEAGDHLVVHPTAARGEQRKQHGSPPGGSEHVRPYHGLNGAISSHSPTRLLTESAGQGPMPGSNIGRTSDSPSNSGQYLRCSSMNSVATRIASALVLASRIAQPPITSRASVKG